MTELSQESPQTDLSDRLFIGDGEMARLMRSHDWAQTPLGSVETWPQSLRTTVSILLSSRYPMFTFWGPHLVKLYNDAYRPVLGVTKHPSALGRCAPEIWSEIWDDIGPLVNQVMTTGEATWADNLPLFIYRSGYTEETYFTFSYSPVRDETGGVGGLFCACTETTEQVLGERRLRTLRDLAAQTGQARTIGAACENAMKTLSNHSADIPFALLYLFAENGDQVYLAGITGLEPDTPSSPRLVSLADAAEDSGWLLAKVAKTAKLERIENINERFGKVKSGPWEESPHTALVIPVASPGQEHPTGVLVAGISARLALDDFYQGFLELVAAQLASAIADARAYEAERQRAEALAEIDQAKTTFFSNISHEFRTPLTLMLAPLEDALANLSEEVSSPLLKEQLQLAQRNGRRLLKLVNTLLDFSRIEAGRIEAIYEPTDLSILTTDLTSTFRSLIERAGMSLVVECTPLPTSVYVDREMWEKIVLNLLSNAFKFTLTGAIAVRLQSDQDHVELTVADTGIGIPVDEIPHLFTRFHRVKGAQGRSFEGSGIGLSLVQELVKLHGGSIQITSQLGQGSCVTVSIPTGLSHLPAERISTHRTLTSTAMGATPYIEEALGWLPEENGAAEWLDREETFLAPARSPIFAALSALNALGEQPSSLSHILVVDDNADVRNYIKRLLEQYYTVEAASNGLEALKLIRDRLPDLILTDVMMPQLDGFELLKALRNDASTRELPIILLSARAGEEARVEGLAAGADDYLIKPFSSRELIARVEASLKMAHIRRESARREQILRLASEQAQQETAATFNRLTQLLETMSDAFVELDKDWRINYQNAAAERINLAKPRSEVLGKTHWEEWADSVGTELEYQYRRAMAEQIPVHFEHHYYYPPHFDVWLEIDAYPSPDRLSIFFRDITKRKQVEATLRENQLQLQRQLAEIEAIYQSAPVGLNFLDKNLRFVRINQRLAEINGLPVEAHLGHTIREVLPEMADMAEQLLLPMLKTGEPLLNVEITGENPAQPGVQRTWLESFLPLKDGDEVIGISTVCEEITNQKQVETALRCAKEELENRVLERTTELQNANVRLSQELWQRERIEHQLRQSEARYRAIVEDQTELIARFLPDSTILFVNDAYCRYFNIQREDIVGKSYTPVIYEADQERVTQLVESITAENPMLMIENRVVNGKGELRWTQWVNRRLYDAEGNVVELQSVGRDITELKQAEKALRESEERLQLALEASGDGIWDWNVVTNEIYYSPQYFQMLGYGAYELPHTVDTWYELVHPEDIVWVKEILAAHLKDGMVCYEFDYRLRTKVGTWKWIADYGKVVARDEQGNPLRMIGTHRDVNDRKLIEAALRRSEEQRRLALDLTHIGFWDLHVPSGNLTWNDNHFTLLGLPISSTPPQYQTWVERIHPDDVQRAEQAFLTSLATHTDYEAEYRVVHPDGSVYWLMARGQAIYDEQDQPLRSLGVILDISDRKHMEASLQESNRRWRSLLDNIQLVVIELNLQGTVEYVNPFFLELTGYHLEEVIGQYWFSNFLPPSQRPSIEFAFHEVLENNFHPHYQNPILTKTNEERLIAWSNTVLRDVAGQAIGTISIGEDITERYKVERMKAEFVSVVSHELRTPLTSMQAALSLLSEKVIDPTSEEGEATIQIATEGTDRLVRLVNDILDLERLESGKVRLDKRFCNVGDLVDVAVAQMQEMANQSGIALQANPCSFQLWADGDRLIQVLTNLLSNAIKFSSDNSTIWLDVKLVDRSEEELRDGGDKQDQKEDRNGKNKEVIQSEGEFSQANKQAKTERNQSLNPTQCSIPVLLFTVKDHGRGIPSDNLESIFDRFHQVDASDSRTKGGTGLGLAICRSIVQQHGGEIWAESVVGKGSTFYFTVPFRTEHTEIPE